MTTPRITREDLFTQLNEIMRLMKESRNKRNCDSCGRCLCSDSSYININISDKITKKSVNKICCKKCHIKVLRYAKFFMLSASKEKNV